MENGKLINEFIKNLKIAGGEILEIIPNDYYIVEAEFGVAENGAVWIDEKYYNDKLFLSEKVAAKLKKENIVKDMNEAMKLIKSAGIFISGPSKTADIESFLVYGAHGPMKFDIFFS